MHELNNQKGHQESDKMLCLIADVIRKAFGNNDTYRIGGDEFVAFALDRSKEETERKISEICVTVEEAGYHAAVGYEYAELGALEFNELVSHAEANMYLDKAEYYKTNDRRR